MTASLSQRVRNFECVSRGWNPWRALRDRRHLRLVFAVLPESCGRGALIEEPNGGRTVMLDYRLGRRDRNAVLAHELVHDERDLLYPPGAPFRLVAKEEHTVNREVARRLVPLDQLDRLVRRILELDQPVHAVDVMEEFDVPLDIAQRALWLLEQARTA